MKRAARAILVVAVVVGIAVWLTLRPAPRALPRETPHRDTTATPLAPLHAEYPDSALETRLRAMVSHAPARVGIEAKHLGSGMVARVNADTLIPLLSLVKLPLAMVVLDQVDRGRWTLDTPVTLLPGDMHPR